VKVESTQPVPAQVDANAPSWQAPLRAKTASETPLRMHVFKQIGSTGGGEGLGGDGEGEGGGALGGGGGG